MKCAEFAPAFQHKLLYSVNEVERLYCEAFDITSGAGEKPNSDSGAKIGETNDFNCMPGNYQKNNFNLVEDLAMKNLLRAFLFLVSFFEVKFSAAQTYHPFPDTLAQWSEGTLYCYVVGPRSCSGVGYSYTLYGDTVIGGYNYKLLGYNLAYTWGDYEPEINYPYQFPGEIFGALREDSSRKVWFRNFDSLLSWVGCFNFSFYPYFPFPVDSDFLLYDFGLGVGDTAYWTAYEFNKVVMMIDSIQLLDGSWRRVIDFDTVHLSSFPTDYWIEGVGSQWGLFGPYCREPFEAMCNLNCFTKIDTLLLESIGFPSLTDCNHIYTGSEAIESQKSILVLPNPASDHITFDPGNFTASYCEISIYNSTGKLVGHFFPLHFSQLKIPVSEIGGDGMYFYTVKLDDDNFFAGKFVIQQ